MDYNQPSKTEDSTETFREEEIDFTHVKILLSDFVETLRRLEKLEERKTQFVAIQNLDSKKLELTMPLVVTIEPTEQDTSVVWSEDLNTYGEGKIEEEAKEDFFKNVEELYFDLKQDQDRLGPAMKKTWKFLQKIIKEI